MKKYNFSLRNIVFANNQIAWKSGIITLLYILGIEVGVLGQVFVQSNLAPFNQHFFVSRVIDYDNDGDEDVIGWNGQLSASAKLYANIGNSQFADVSAQANFPKNNEGICADLDRNGYTDVYYISGDTLIFSLNQGGVFTSPSLSCGKVILSGLFGSANLRSVRLGDYNNDGKYDVVAHVLNGSTSIVMGKSGSWTCGVCGFALSDQPAQTLLTINNAIDPLLTLADVNNDGAFDLLIGTGTQSSPYASGYWNFYYSIYLNNGAGAFSLFNNSGYGLGRSSAFGSLGEFNNDGRVDIFSGAADCCVGGVGGGGSVNPLYTFLSTNGGGYSSSNSVMTRATDRKYYNAATVLDLNLDGYQDVVWTDIYAYAYSSSALQCYLNNGNSTFTESSSSLGIQLGTSAGPVLHTSQRSTVVDINNDLKPDLNIQSFGTYNGSFQNNYTMMNSSTNNAVKVKLDACSGLKEGWGARVSYKYAGAWKHLQHTAYASANQPFLYLGMGSSSSIDSLKVIWVGGSVSTLTQIQAGSYVVIHEDVGCTQVNGGVQHITKTDSIAAGATYTFGTQVLNAEGIYTETFVSASGCDSIVTLTLSFITPTLNCQILAPTTSLCAGESVDLSISATGLTAGTSTLPANLQQGLVAYYPFNGNANDESGNGHNGTVGGAMLSADRFGNGNSCYSFDNNQQISIPGTTALNQFPITISLWYNLNSNSSSQASSIFTKYSPGTWNGFGVICANQILANGNTQLQTAPFYLRSNSNRIIGLYGEPSFAQTDMVSSNWYHLVFVADQNGGKLYVDGQLIQTHNWTGSSGSCSNALNWKIGGFYNTWFQGKIDDVFIYNRALSASDVSQLHNAQAFSWSDGSTNNSITVSPTTNTTYSCTVTQGAQTCTASVDITVNPAVTNAVTATITQGQSYTLGTQTLTTAGTYTEVFTSAAGCDSTVTLTLAVDTLLTCNIEYQSNVMCEFESQFMTMTTNLPSASNINYTWYGDYNNVFPTNDPSQIEVGGGGSGSEIICMATVGNKSCIDTVQLQINNITFIPGGSSNEQYIWFTGPGQSLDNPSEISICVDAASDFSFIPNMNFFLDEGFNSVWKIILSNDTIDLFNFIPIELPNGAGSITPYLTSSGDLYFDVYTFYSNVDIELFYQTTVSNCMNVYNWESEKVLIHFIGRMEIISSEIIDVSVNNCNGESQQFQAHVAGSNLNYDVINITSSFKFNWYINDVLVETNGDSLFSSGNLLSGDLVHFSTVIAAGLNGGFIPILPYCIYSNMDSQPYQVIVETPISAAYTATIIEGQSYTLGTQTLTNAGTYTEVFTSAAGCDSTVTLTLAVEPLLTCNITAATTTLCAGESVNLSISSSGGASGLPTNLQQGLVAYYPFNGNANDESGNGNNGTVNGATLTVDRFGNGNSAYSFNANYLGHYSGADYIRCQNPGPLGSSNRTINFWVKTDSQSISQLNNIAFSYGSNEQVYGEQFRVTFGGSCSQSISAVSYSGNRDVSYVPSGEWEMISITYDSNISLNCNGVKIYLNGIDIQSYCIDVAGTDWNTSGVNPITIGRYHDLNWTIDKGFFKGQLDDMMVFNRALSSSEIQQLYTSQSYAWNTGATTNFITVSPTTNSTYSCTVTSGIQTCTASVDITVTPQQTFYADADGDGYGNPQVVVSNCNQPVGYVTDNTDCNDNNAAVHAALVETCNGIDDNCNGQIDEGLTLGAVSATAVTTAIYPTCSGNALKSANLNNGSNSAIIDGSGMDLWYSLTAQYNTLRAGLSAAFGDNEIRLYQVNNGCFQLIETEHEIYTATNAATGNQVLLSDALVVGQTYYVAVHNLSGTMNPSAKMCFNHFMGSTCDHYYSNNTGVYPNVCSQFKAQFKGNVTNYIFDVLSCTQNNQPVSVTPWSYTTPSSSSIITRLGTLLPANMGNAQKVYTLRIPVVYAIPDAAGNYVSLTADATTTCTVALNAEASVSLRTLDRCPTLKAVSSSISVDRTICGALRYEWEFTQQLPTIQPAVTVLGGLNSSVLFLNNVPGMGLSKTYNVRVRPIHANGEVGAWGSVQCLKTGTSGMVIQNENENESDSPIHRSTDSPIHYAIYPNPTSTGHFTLMSNLTEEEAKQIAILDITGKTVYKNQVVLNGNAVEIEYGQLASGVYVVMVGEEKIRLIVE